MKNEIRNMLFCLAIFFAGRPVVAQETGNNNHVAAWTDEAGNFINAHGAGILFHKGIYYMYGEIKKGETWYVPGQDWEDYRVPAGGISCYTSTDLLHWKYSGVALQSTTGDSSYDLDTGRVIERPKVIYNTSTRKFVMWMHIDRNNYSYARAGVAISDRPEGPYHYLGSMRPNNQMSRDMTLFKDDNGKAYLIYTSENNNTMQVCQLADDYLSPTKKFVRILENQRREAPAVFKYAGKYYLVTSLCSGWSPNAADYAVANEIMGKWEQKGNPCTGEGSATTFQSQGTFIIKVKDKPASWLFMADRWNKTDLQGSGYLWLPLSLKDGKMEIKQEETK